MGKQITSDYKIACFRTWRPDHNNVRYAALFPYLSSMVKFYGFTFSKHLIIRAAQSRLWKLSRRRIIYPAVLKRLNRKFENLYTIDFNQIPFWRGRVIIDIDDAKFTPAEIRNLNQQNVAGVIVTTERIKATFEQRGVISKIHVIPQGVSRGRLDSRRVEEIRTQFKKQDLVVGYHSPRLTLVADGVRRPKQGLNDLDILLTAAAAARKIEPRLAVWLIGHASEELKRFAESASWIKLFGYIPFEDILNYVENFDIGIYPRVLQLPLGRFSVKLAQYMVCGVPILSTNVDESFIVNEAQSGIVADSPSSFTQALQDLVRSELMRRELGNAGRKYAATNLDWDILIPRYKKILADNLS